MAIDFFVNDAVHDHDGEPIMIDSESALAGGGYSTTVVLLCMPKYKLNPRPSGNLSTLKPEG
jgi:hypothetical protein